MLTQPKCKLCGSTEGLFLKPKTREIYICEDCVTLIETAIKWILSGLLEDTASQIQPKEEFTKIGRELTVTEIQT